MSWHLDRKVSTWSRPLGVDSAASPRWVTGSAASWTPMVEGSGPARCPHRLPVPVPGRHLPQGPVEGRVVYPAVVIATGADHLTAAARSGLMLVTQRTALLARVPALAARPRTPWCPGWSSPTPIRPHTAIAGHVPGAAWQALRVPFLRNVTRRVPRGSAEWSPAAPSAPSSPSPRRRGHRPARQVAPCWSQVPGRGQDAG